MLDSHYGVFSSQIPPKCMPSPRTVARVASNSRPGGVGGTPFSLRRRFDRFETVPDGVELDYSRPSISLPINLSRRQPIVHPACDPPLCSDCRQFDARFPQSPGISNTSIEDSDRETPDFSLLLDSDRPMTPDYSEEDIVRMMLTATSSSASNGGGFLWFKLYCHLAARVIHWLNFSICDAVSLNSLLPDFEVRSKLQLPSVGHSIALSSTILVAPDLTDVKYEYLGMGGNSISVDNQAKLISCWYDLCVTQIVTVCRLRGAWWCDKCVALLSAPDVGIGQLFALLRQWTPCTQLQLDTIVMEVGMRFPIFHFIFGKKPAPFFRQEIASNYASIIMSNDDDSIYVTSAIVSSLVF
ncbi:unnamed protein product [Rodentolepis nana]|uniref:DUF5726 domain-containing protein n=1 Tax=Rodentolepis nana TaxID=102285 RepID=A0A0R3T1D7_RODNA|nr:unnamed protein product [Rodentolepis nana]